MDADWEANLRFQQGTACRDALLDDNRIIRCVSGLRGKSHTFSAQDLQDAHAEAKEKEKPEADESRCCQELGARPQRRHRGRRSRRLV